MAKVVLLSPPYVQDYMRNARCDFVSLSHSSWYPIWLAEAGCYLESKGHKTLQNRAQPSKVTLKFYSITAFRNCGNKRFSVSSLLMNRPLILFKANLATLNTLLGWK